MSKADELRREAREVLILWSTAKDRASLAACYRDEAYNLRMAARKAATTAGLTREESRTINALLRDDPFAWAVEDRSQRIVAVCPGCRCERTDRTDYGCCVACGEPLVETTPYGADMLLDYLARRDDDTTGRAP